MASKRKSVTKALSSTSSDSSLDSDESGNEKRKLQLPGGLNFNLDGSDFEKRVKNLKPPSQDSMSSEGSEYIRPDLSGDVHKLLNKTYGEEDFVKKQRLPLPEPTPDKLNTRTTRSKTVQSSTRENESSDLLGKVRSAQHKNNPKQPRLSIEQKTTTPSPCPKSRRSSSSKQLRHVTPAMKKQYVDDATTTASVFSTKSTNNSSASVHSEPQKVKTKNGAENTSSRSSVVSIKNSEQLLCAAPKGKVLHSTPIDSRRAAAFPDAYKLTPIASQMGTEMFTVPRPVAKRNTHNEETDSDVPRPNVLLQSSLHVGSTPGSGSDTSAKWDFKRINNWIQESKPDSQLKSPSVYEEFDAIEESFLPRRPYTSISKVAKVETPVAFGTFIKETLTKKDVPTLKQNSVNHKTAQETTSLQKPVNKISPSINEMETITTNGDATGDNTYDECSSSNSSGSPHGRNSVTNSVSEIRSPPSNSEAVVYARKSLPVSPAKSIHDTKVEKEQDESADATSLFEKSATHTLDARRQSESMRKHQISANEKINFSSQQQKVGETSKHRQSTSTALKDNLTSHENYLITKQRTASSNLNVGKSLEKSSTHTINDSPQNQSLNENKKSINVNGNFSRQQDEAKEFSKPRYNTYDAISSSNSSCSPHGRKSVTNSINEIISNSEAVVYARKSLPVVPVVPVDDKDVGKDQDESTDATSLFEKSSTHTLDTRRQSVSMKEHEISANEPSNFSGQQQKVRETSKHGQSTSTALKDNLTSHEDYLFIKQHTASSNLNGEKSLEKSSTDSTNDSRHNQSVKESRKSTNVNGHSSREQDVVRESSKQKQLTSTPQGDNLTLQKVSSSSGQQERSKRNLEDSFVGRQEEYLITKQPTTSSNLKGGRSIEKSSTHAIDDSRQNQSVKENRKSTNVNGHSSREQDEVRESSKQKQLASTPQEDNLALQKIRSSSHSRQREVSKTSLEDSFMESQEDNLITKKHIASSNLNGGKSLEKSSTHTTNDSRQNKSVKENQKSINVKGNSSRQQDELRESSKQKQLASTPQEDNLTVQKVRYSLRQQERSKRSLEDSITGSQEDNLTLQKVRSSSRQQERSKRSLEDSITGNQEDYLITKERTASSNLNGGKSLEKFSTHAIDDTRPSESVTESKKSTNMNGNSSRQQDEVRESSKQKQSTSMPQEDNLTVQKVRSSLRQRDRSKRSLEGSFVGSQEDYLIAKQHTASSNLNEGRSHEKSSTDSTKDSRQNQSLKESRKSTNVKGNSSRQPDDLRESSKQKQLTSALQKDNSNFQKVRSSSRQQEKSKRSLEDSITGSQDDNLTLQKVRSSSRQQERSKRSLEDSFVGSQEEYLITKQQMASTYLKERKTAGKSSKVNSQKKVLSPEHSPLWEDEFSDLEVMGETIRSPKKITSRSEKLKSGGKPLKSHSRRKAVSSSSSMDEDDDLEVVYEKVRTPHNASSQSIKLKSPEKVLKANSVTVKKETSPDHYSASSMDEDLNTESQMFSEPQILSGSTKSKPVGKYLKENSPKKAPAMELSTLSVDDDLDVEFEEVVNQGQKSSRNASRSTKLKPQAVKRLFDHISKTVESPQASELLPSSRPRTRKRAGSRIPGNSSSQSSVNPSEIYGEFLVSRSRSQDSTLASKANATASIVAAGPSKKAIKEDSPQPSPIVPTEDSPPPSPIVPTEDIPPKKQPMSKEEYFKRLNEELDRRGIQERLVLTDPNFIDKEKLKRCALIWGGANLTEGELDFFHKKCNEQSLKIVNGLRANSSLPGKVFTYKDLQATLVNEGLIPATVAEPFRTMVETWTTKQQREAKKIGLMPLSKSDNPDMIKISFLKSND